MKYCTNCGAALEDSTASFCAECGKLLSSASGDSVKNTEIKGNAQYTVEKGKYITTPKSGKGRLVILNQPILDLLKEWKREQTKWLFSMGLPHTGFIVTQDDGEMLNPNAPTKYLVNLESAIISLA